MKRLAALLMIVLCASVVTQAIAFVAFALADR